ncbi:pdrg1 prefoldin-like subunit [Brevipalpus obovatus]|uniref:pdrg1 prefoldin-like subunit n=1 Tax=Brevipalpus obovatus TaxID=246614 RepID=UPI003D9F4CFA
MDNLLGLLQESERLGEKILADREMMVEFDRRRNKNREALRAIEKQSQDKVWLNFANMFVRTEKSKAQDIIKRDQESINSNIDKTRNAIKDNMVKLSTLEGKKEHEMFKLNPLSSKEVSAMSSVLPNVI